MRSWRAGKGERERTMPVRQSPGQAARPLGLLVTEAPASLRKWSAAMKPYVPLIQTGLWIAAFIAAAWIFRREIASLQRALHERLQAGAPVKLAWLELGEVKTEVRTMRAQVDGLAQQVTTLFLATMSPSMYLNLRKLESGRFGRFEASDGLKRELRHLRDLGYVEVNGIRQLPETGDELADYVTITPTGRDFVRLRESSAPAG